MKSRLVAAAVAAALGLALTAPPVSAQAPDAPGAGRQRGQGRQGGRAASVATVSVDAISTIATLTAEQKTKIKAIQDKLQETTRSLRPQQGAPRDPASREKIAEAQKAAVTEIEAVLTPEQKTKVQAAIKELGGLQALGIPMAIAVELKLTDPQKKQLAEIAKAALAETQALAPDERRSGARERMQANRAKAEAILTTEQKAIVAKAAERRRQRNAPSPPPPP